MQTSAHACTIAQPDDRQPYDSTQVTCPSQHSDLVTKARSGDRVAQDELILVCLPIMRQYVRNFYLKIRHTDLEDLVQEAMLSITLHLSLALDKRDPVAYMVSIGYHRIQQYITCEDDLIQHRPEMPRQAVASLEACYHDHYDEDNPSKKRQLAAPDFASKPKADYTKLYAALEKLSPKRRNYIAQHFGLLGHPETPVKEMAATRREQQTISKTITMTKQTLAACLRRSDIVSVA